LSIWRLPVSIESGSMVTATRPVFAAGSKSIVTLILSKRPRTYEMSRWLTANCTDAWPRDSAYSAAGAGGPAAAGPARARQRRSGREAFRGAQRAIGACYPPANSGGPRRLPGAGNPPPLAPEPAGEIALELHHVRLARIHHVTRVEIVVRDSSEHFGRRIEL